VKFNTKVKSATWDDDAGVWRLTLIAQDGSEFEDQCEILINGSGVLKSVVPSLLIHTQTYTNILFYSTYKNPNVPGIGDYHGKLMHTAAWDSSYDLTGKTVAVIGGGSSAVQVIPNIQPGALVSEFICRVLIICSCRKFDPFSTVVRMDHNWIWWKVCRSRGNQF
jgi:cation diffusion facilitator CzcD-associated flavoprotein CzcO